jgi:transposase
MHGAMSAVEVITSVQRRRRWSAEEKRRIVAASAQAGRTVSEVAREHGVLPSQLFTWRRQLLASALDDSAGGDGFVPVRIAEGSIAPREALATDDRHRIGIKLPSGVEISVGRDVEVETLRRVLRALAAG